MSVIVFMYSMTVFVNLVQLNCFSHFWSMKVEKLRSLLAQIEHVSQSMIPVTVVSFNTNRPFIHLLAKCTFNSSQCLM